MLLNLKIRDFAIIDAVEFELHSGFTVVTGETGAGKSILINALTLALGGRASTDLIRDGAQKAEVEALFDISEQPTIQARLDQRDLVGDDPNALIVRRVVGNKGRGKVVINGRLSTVASLAEIVRGLVDISGQHEQQSLLVVDNHIEILDAFGELEDSKAGYRAVYDELKRRERERAALEEGEGSARRRADYARFQIDEIEKVSPVEGEEEELEAQHQILANADRLGRGVAVAEALLYNEDGSAFDKLSRSAAELEALLKIDPGLEEISQTVNSARRDIQEAAQQLQHYGGHIEADPARLERVDGRLDEIRRLCRKHGLSVSDLVRRLEELRGELDGLENTDQQLADLESEITRLVADLWLSAAKLSKARRKAAKQLSKRIETEVADMDLEGARFGVSIESAAREDSEDPTRGLSPFGVDRIEFLWSANPGEQERPLARIVSGGELSRLMLAVKRVLSSRDLVSMYVFDEVDTGLGGRVADRIGTKIQDVARNHQAIAVTHLAPIAAKAEHHFQVTKQPLGDRTVSVIENIKGKARADEIARMIDGAKITKATRQAAREMLARN